MRILRNVGIGLAALIVVVVIAAIVIVRTDWFRTWVAQKIVTETEAATGGTATIGSFSFEWSHLRAVVTDFVIHGNEPAGSAPFISANRMEVDLRFFTNKHFIGVSYLAVDQPQANVMVFPDGRTNVPTPKQKQPQSNTTALESVVDLAVGHFALANGLFTFNSQKQPINLRGNNLRMQLWYSLAKDAYQGQLSLDPLYVLYGRNTPVNFTITLPVSLQRDRIDVDTAKISTPNSQVYIKASIANMKDPRTSAHVKGAIALADLKNAANLPLDLNARNVPRYVNIDAGATVSNNVIQVAGLRLGIGSSRIDASGTLKDQSGNGALQFRSDLNLGELGRLAKVAARPEGTVNLNGTAKMDASNNYLVTGNVAARNVSLQQGAQRISNVNLYSAIRLDPHNLDLNGMRLDAFGGEVAGDASLRDFAQYHFAGNVKHLDLEAAAHAAGNKKFAYDGVVSGPLELQGNLKAPGTESVQARANLAIAPGRRGVPVSGRLNVNYNGAANTVSLANSYIALPHTRLNLSGAINTGLHVQLTTTNLKDLFAGLGLSAKPPVELNGGTITFSGTVSGSLTSPRIAGHLAANRFTIEGRAFDQLAADVNASKSGASIQNASLIRGPMQAQLAATVGLHDWSPKPYDPLTADLTLRNGDLADIMALAGQQSSGYSGALTASARITGTVGNPRGTANLNVANGTIAGESFDQIAAQVNLQDQLVTIPSAYIAAGSARVNLSAEFQHPRDSFSAGRIHARVASNQVDLAQLRALQKQRPGTAGVLNLNADLAGTLRQTAAPVTSARGTPKVAAGKSGEFLLTSVNADASARGLRFEGQNYGDFKATARTSGSMVSYNVASDFAGSNIHVNGTTQLARGYPTNADASIAHLPIERVLAVAQRTDIPARGNLSANAHFSGTMENPQGNADLSLTGGNIYNEPIDRLQARISYLARSVDIPQFEVVSGQARIDLTAHYDHPEGDLQSGSLRFGLDTSRIDLAKIKNVQKARPGLGGTVQMNARGAATVQKGEPRVLLSDLNADIAARGISAEGKNFGDLTLAAHSTGGQRVDFNLDSDFAGSTIHGAGNAQLRADYPVDARLTFNNVMWSRIHPLLGSSTGVPDDYDVATDGQITVNGPVMNVNALRGTFELSRLQISTVPGPDERQKPIVIRNNGPIVAALDGGVVTIRSAHLAGPKTDIQAGGTVALQAKTLNLTLNANTDLSLIQNFNQNFFSSGSIVLATDVRGTLTAPLVNGRMELHNASVNYIDYPNGISHANGVILFNGNNAVIQSFTGESGGGKVTVAGFAAFSPTIRFGLKASAQTVRVRVQQGVSVTVDSTVNFTGTADNSLASGTVTLDKVAYNPQSDFGSLLSRTAPPVQTPTAPSPFLEHLKLDVRMRTSPALSVQASLAQNLQVDADLRLRGSAAQPGMTGHVNISEGKLVFFGSTYTVNTGVINFYNPLRIEPVLNISLETMTKGVDVVLNVTGPIDNMKLTYTSDPPLQFQEIVALLATGKTPTSDPTLLANQPAQPQQSFTQMGESAVVSQAVANPVASQLQRVFGVSQLKIDPTFVSGSEVPQARMTLQQQITANLTFTYVTDLTSSNTQIIRVEWAFNPQWSAIANRDQNGIVSVDFTYKREFR